MGDATGRRRTFGYGAITLCGREFNPVRLERRFITPAGPVGARTRDPATPRTQPPTGITRTRFGLIRFRSPLLTEYPFLQVLRCFTSLRTPRPRRCRPMTAGGFPHSEILGSKPRWRLPEAYRSLTRPSSVLSAKASTIRPSRATTTDPRQASKHRTTDLRTHDHKTIRTKEQNPKKSGSSEKTVNKKRRIFLARVHSPVLKPPPRPDTTPTPDTRTHAEPGMGTNAGPEGPVAVREPKSMPVPQEPPISSTPATPGRRTIRTGGETGAKPAPGKTP